MSAWGGLVEALALVVSILAARVLLRPLLRGREPPGWLQRTRARGRPGVPVTGVLAALVLMLIVWLIGERRGLPAAALFLVWIAAPLAAWEVLRAWRRR